LKIAILGSGPIPNKLAQELDATSVVELFTSQKVRVDGIKVSDYRSLLNMTPDFEVVVLAWRGIPKAGTEKAEVLKHIVREASPDALIINLSSVSVYGQNSETNFETTTPRPINPYGYSKYYLERYLNIFASSKVCNLRISNVFGHLDFDDILNRMLLSAENSVSIKIVSPDEVTRDFISINTLTSNLKDLLLVSNNLGRREIFNVSSENTIKLTQLKNLVEEFLHKSVFCIEESGTTELILNSSVSNQKIRSFLNVDEKSELVELTNYIQKVTSKNN
jgi:nucleoside-diphosphate-sugar epimerase